MLIALIILSAVLLVSLCVNAFAFYLLRAVMIVANQRPLDQVCNAPPHAQAALALAEQITQPREEEIKEAQMEEKLRMQEASRTLREDLGYDLDILEMIGRER